MSALTLAYHSALSDAETGGVTELVQANGGMIHWLVNPTYGRSYALIENAGKTCIDAVRARAGAAFNDGPIIALAVLPSVPEALPAILHALGEGGAPDGIRSCIPVGDAAIVEWDLDRTGLAIVLGLIDIEIARFRARRVNTLLTPLPLAWTARIAAEGLGAPEIAPNRVLEALLEEYHVAG